MRCIEFYIHNKNCKMIKIRNFIDSVHGEDKSSMNMYTIAKVAEMLEVTTPQTIRQWEKQLEGILNIPRSETGRRYYTEEEITALRKVKELRERGIRFQKIREILSTLDFSAEIVEPGTMEPVSRQENTVTDPTADSSFNMNDVTAYLKIREKTLRKWITALKNHGYRFEPDRFTSQDLEVFNYLKKLLAKYVSLDKACEMTIQFFDNQTGKQHTFAHEPSESHSPDALRASDPIMDSLDRFERLLQQQKKWLDTIQMEYQLLTNEFYELKRKIVRDSNK
jgi:DNA-binding transcriptional MerR regulator